MQNIIHNTAMSKKIVSLGDFKARKEKAEQAAERREREAQERIYAAPAYKGFLEVMTPTPINPHNMPIVMRNVLFSMALIKSKSVSFSCVIFRPPARISLLYHLTW